MLFRIQNDWAERLHEEMQAPYMQELEFLLKEKYETFEIFPPRPDLFNALHYTSYEQTKIVILGQDPYHGAGQAHGLSFSVLPGIKAPPSLKNIFKELESDAGCTAPEHGCLEAWAKQGVLLLNTVLTVEAGKPNSHQGMGWERFTDRIIEELNKRQRPVVFLLWGKHAQAKTEMIDSDKHCVISSAHPSPFAARKGFFGSRPFTRANAFLAGIGSEPIDWQLPAAVANNQ